MTNCKKIPIPRLEGVDVNKLMLFYKMGNKFFLRRYNVDAWKSFDLIKNTTNSPMMKHFPAIEKWVATCYKKRYCYKSDSNFIHIYSCS